MAPAERIATSITMFGRPPWGFQVSGGKEFNQPLVISSIESGSLAARSKLSPGDVIISINGDFVAQMTHSESENKIKAAVGSLYLVLEKNAAAVTVQPSGEVNVDGSRDVYNEDTRIMEALSRHNRCAKPFSASALYSTPSPKPVIPESTTAPKKPPGFKSVVFRPNASKPNGGQNGFFADRAPASFNAQPKRFVPVA